MRRPLTAMATTVLGLIGTLVVLVGSARAKDVVCRIELDREVLPADEKQTAVIKVSLDAPRPPANAAHPPVNLSIVLDRSGSMAGQKLEKAKDAAIEALRRLDGDDIFSLVVYDHSVETLIPAQSARHVERLETKIRAIRSGGNTALFGGVSQGAAEIRRHLGRKYVHRLILLSDGLANVGPSSPDDLERLGRALIKEDISVTTVGVGTDYNEDLMTRLSQASDGNSYFVENSRDLPRIFAAELGDVLSVVAKKVIIEIELKGGTRPIRIIGRDGRIKGSTVELGLNQLYGGQEKYALIEVEIPAGRHDETREVATARVRYENALTNQPTLVSATAAARFSTDRDVVISNVNAAVQRDVFANNIAIAKDQSVEFMDKGEQAAAVQNLREVQVQFKQVAEQYNLEGMQDDLDQLEKETTDLEQQGMGKVMRKSFRTRSYQIRSQQEAQ